jgi:hypothetical protein
MVKFVLASPTSVYLWMSGLQDAVFLQLSSGNYLEGARQQGVLTTAGCVLFGVMVFTLKVMALV